MSLSAAIPEAAIIREEQEEEQDEREEIDKRPKIECFNEIDKEFDILGARRFIWIAIGGNEWSLLDDEKNEIIITPEGSGYTATLHFADGARQRVTNTPLPLAYCSGICEDYARRHLKISFADMRAPWMSTDSAPTQSQRNYLEKKGAWKDDMTKSAASIEIRKIIASKNKQRRSMASEPITNKQGYFLQNHGIDTSAMTKLQAMQAISKIKNEGVKYG
jgi:hypothetical protein